MSGKYLLLNNLQHSLPKSFGQNLTVEKSLRFSNTLASLARLSFVLLFFPCWDKQTQHVFLYVTPPPQTQPMILLFAVLMRYLHVSWSRKRDIGDITSSPPLWSDLTDRKIYTHDINVFRNVCSPNEQLAHFFCQNTSKKQHLEMKYIRSF